MTATTKSKTPAKALDNVAAQVKENLEGFVKAGQEQAHKQFEQTVAVTKEQVEKSQARFLKGYEEVTAASRQNVEALIQSVTAMARGTEEFGKELLAFTQASFDKSAAVGKAVMTAKSLREVVDLQNEYATSSVDAAVAEIVKLQEMSAKLANDAFAPIGARVNATVGSLGKPLSA